MELSMFDGENIEVELMADHNGEWVPITEISAGMDIPRVLGVDAPARKSKYKRLISTSKSLAGKVAVKVLTALIGEPYITVKPDKGEYTIAFVKKKKNK